MNGTSNICQNEVRYSTKAARLKCARVSVFKSENTTRERKQQRVGRVRSSEAARASTAKDCMTHLRARLLLSCVMGRLKSLASTTQYITLDKEFRIGNCFPLHAQIAIKNNKSHPSMSLSVFLYQSLLTSTPPLPLPPHPHPPPPLRSAFINLSSTHRSSSSSFLLPIAFSICLSSSLTSIPINFCVGMFVCYHRYPSITPSAPLSFFKSLTREQCFAKPLVHFHLSPWRSVKNEIADFLRRRTAAHACCCFAENHYKQINKQGRFAFFFFFLE